MVYKRPLSSSAARKAGLSAVATAAAADTETTVLYLVDPWPLAGPNPVSRAAIAQAQQAAAAEAQVGRG